VDEALDDDAARIEDDPTSWLTCLSPASKSPGLLEDTVEERPAGLLADTVEGTRTCKRCGASKKPDLGQPRELQRIPHHINCGMEEHTKKPMMFHDGTGSDGNVKLLFREGYRARFGTLHGQMLWDEMYKLHEWFHMRHYIQVDNFDERMSMELAMVVALGTLVPKLCLIMFNYIFAHTTHLFAKAVNIVTLWDFAFIVAFVLRSLMVTLAFNDVYETHKEQLENLKHHVELEEKAHEIRDKDKQRNDKDNGRHTNFSSKLEEVYEKGEAVALVQGYIERLDSFDSPSSFFGLRVNRKLMTGLSSTALFVLIPQLVSLFQDADED